MKIQLLESVRRDFRDKYGIDILDKFDRLVKSDTSGEYTDAEKDYGKWVGKNTTLSDIEKLFKRSKESRESSFEDKFGNELTDKFNTIIKGNNRIPLNLQQEVTWMSNKYLPADLRIFINKLPECKFVDKYGKELFDRFKQTRNNLQQMKDEFIKEKELSNYNTYSYWLKDNFKPEDLEKFLNQLEDKKQFYPDQAVEDGSELCYSSDNYRIYKILNFAASSALGKATGWCTSNRYAGSSEDENDMLNKVHPWNPTQDTHWKSYGINKNRKMWMVFHLQEPKVKMMYDGSYAGLSEPFEEEDYLKYNIILDHGEVLITHPIKDREVDAVEYFKSNPEVFNYFVNLKENNNYMMLKSRYNNSEFQEMLKEVRGEEPVEEIKEFNNDLIRNIKIPSSSDIKNIPENIINNESFWLRDNGSVNNHACVINGHINRLGTKIDTRLPMVLIAELQRHDEELNPDSKYKFQYCTYHAPLLGIYYSANGNDYLFIKNQQNLPSQYTYGDAELKIEQIKRNLGISESIRQENTMNKLDESLASLPIPVRRAIFEGKYINRLKEILQQQFGIDIEHMKYVPQDFKSINTYNMQVDFQDDRKLYIVTTEKRKDDGKKLLGYQCYIPGITCDNDRCIFPEEEYSRSMQGNTTSKYMWKYQPSKRIKKYLAAYGYIDLDASKYDQEAHDKRAANAVQAGSDRDSYKQRYKIEPDENGVYQQTLLNPEEGRDKSGYPVSTQGELKQRLSSIPELKAKLSDLSPSIKRWIELNLYKKVKEIRELVLPVINDDSLIFRDYGNNSVNKVRSLQRAYNDLLATYQKALEVFANIEGNLSEIKFEQLPDSTKTIILNCVAEIDKSSNKFNDMIKELQA